jgi:ribosomal protein L11 methylase PrmA
VCSLSLDDLTHTYLSWAPSDVLDQAFLAGLHAGNPSMLPHVDLSDPTTHPRRTLDLGCGSGAWIISAASLWPQTRFVGFDLVPQIANLSVFEETSAPNSAVPPTKRFSLTQRRATKNTHPNGTTIPPLLIGDSLNAFASSMAIFS